VTAALSQISPLLLRIGAWWELRSFLWRGPHDRQVACSGLSFSFPDDHHVDPTIEGAAGFRAIAGDGMIFAVTAGGQPLRGKAVFHDQKANHLGRASGREFPV
jgi:hypothetical protein